MRIKCFSDFEELAALAPEWNRLAREVPFRCWEWLGGWWRHYGSPDSGGTNHTQIERAGSRELCVAAIYDAAGVLAGLAPWYLQRSARGGVIVRFLGSGEVCSDYLTVLCAPGREAEIAAVLADWLVALRKDDADGRPLTWDRLEFNGIVESDEAMQLLVEGLAERGAIVDRRPAEHCWRIELPATWDEYLAGLSKSHRKQLRRFERRLFATRRAVLHTATSDQELGQAFEILVELHRLRRESQGDRGRFHSRQFTDFHREVARQFLHRGLLRLSWLELDGRPVASEYQILGGQMIYAYQSGIDPAALEQEPGRLATLATLQAAIQSGYRTYDLLRGDEAYKAHWRAQPLACADLRVLPGCGADWVRHGVWVARENIRSWAKAGWQWAGEMAQG
jgi:CelD/BcsL family acetyltransferase involved in cellulose biosynthesis